MNQRASLGDPYELSIAFWRQLGRADQCRLVDAMMEEIGPLAPIPQFEDIREDAVWWLQSAPDSVTRTYLVELFCALPRERQEAFIAWAQKNRKPDVPE